MAVALIKTDYRGLGQSGLDKCKYKFIYKDTNTDLKMIQIQIKKIFKETNTATDTVALIETDDRGLGQSGPDLRARPESDTERPCTL